jgi:threonine synthase
MFVSIFFPNKKKKKKRGQATFSGRKKTVSVRGQFMQKK